MSININFYNKNTVKLTEQYNSLTFEQVHKNIINFLPEKGKILDVGCGSGRDAFALANMGHKVTAVDPAFNMLIKAKENFQHDNISLINDQMPTLDKIKQLDEKYDFILLSAVWMHVEQKDRKEAFENLPKMSKKASPNRAGMNCSNYLLFSILLTSI